MLIWSSSIVYEKSGDGEMIVYDTVTDKTHVLNSSVAMLFQECNNQEKHCAVDGYLKKVKELLSEPVDDSVLIADAEELLAQFQSAGI